MQERRTSPNQCTELVNILSTDADSAARADSLLSGTDRDSEAGPVTHAAESLSPLPALTRAPRTRRGRSQSIRRTSRDRTQTSARATRKADVRHSRRVRCTSRRRHRESGNTHRSCRPNHGRARRQDTSDIGPPCRPRTVVAFTSLGALATPRLLDVPTDSKHVDATYSSRKDRAARDRRPSDRGRHFKAPLGLRQHGQVAAAFAVSQARRTAAVDTALRCGLL